MISAALFNVGTVTGLLGIIWYALDHNATAPGWLLGAGLICLVIGVGLA